MNIKNNKNTIFKIKRNNKNFSDKFYFIYLFIYLRSLGAKKIRKSSQGNSYIATSNRERVFTN